MNRPEWKTYETSIFSEMSQLAQKHSAVNLAQGFPDFDGPEEIKEAAIKAIRDNKNQYAPSHGILELREKLSQKQAETSGIMYDPATEITIFSGATEAMFCAVTALCKPGDVIHCFEPFYESYPFAAELVGARIKAIPLTPPDWTIDFERLESELGPKSKAFVLNTPHNPTGRVFTKIELEKLAKLIIKHDLILITDEVYEELVFTPSRHLAPATIEGLKERTISISSTSKTYSFTGWKIGYAFAPKALTKLIRIPHQYTVFCSATPLQWGMMAALDLGKTYYHLFREDYAKRRHALYLCLQKHGFKCKPSEGSYFITADYSSVADIGDQEFARELTKRVGVATIPISGFYNDPKEAELAHRYVRFAFCKDLKTIAKADKLLGEGIALMKS